MEARQEVKTYLYIAHILISYVSTHVVVRAVEGPAEGGGGWVGEDAARHHHPLALRHGQHRPHQAGADRPVWADTRYIFN